MNNYTIICKYRLVLTLLCSVGIYFCKLRVKEVKSAFLALFLILKSKKDRKENVNDSIRNGEG